MSASEVDALFRAIRAQCSAGTWSSGVELVRAEAVTGVAADEDQVTCRVRIPQRVVAPTVLLYPADEEWDCDCESKLPVCEHVAAAIIALKRARESGQQLPTAGSSDARIVYRLRRDKGRLLIARAVVKADGSERPIEGTLAGLASKMGGQFVVTPNQDDLAIDRALSALGNGPASAEVMGSILRWLSSSDRVELDGQAVRVSNEGLAPHARVDEEGTGFRVTIEANPKIDEVLAPGAARAGDTLHPLLHPDLSGVRLENLPSS
ncbi:MAG TPA: hypothetical protein VL137_12005 [Polyangiaceae bacterium]|nr:hypothetical protein [Polyangiaceae bacterium]